MSTSVSRGIVCVVLCAVKITSVTSESSVATVDIQSPKGSDFNDNFDEIFSDHVPNRQQFYVHLSDCSDKYWINITGTSGEILGIEADTELSDSFLVCQWAISVPDSRHLSADVVIPEPCFLNVQISVYELEPTDNTIQTLGYVECTFTTLLISTTRQLHFRLERLQTVTEIPMFRIRFQATGNSMRHRLSVVFTGQAIGYISTPGFYGRRVRPSNMQASYTLIVPQAHFVMISSSGLDFQTNIFCSLEKVEFFAVDPTGAKSLVFRKCESGRVPAKLYNSSLTVQYMSAYVSPATGFKFLFSFLQKSDVPHQLTDGLFNCSVPHYASFKQHLECNLEPECQGGEDEGGHCPFSPSGCHGKVGFQETCYFLVQTSSWLPLHSGHEICREKGGEYAMLKTRGHWEAIVNIVQIKHYLGNLYGLGLRTYTPDMPDIYLQSVKWADNTVAYHLNITEKRYFSFDTKAPMYLFAVLTGWPKLLAYSLLAQIPIQQFMCQIRHENVNKITAERIVLTQISVSPLLANVVQSHIKCTQGHVTHDFLSCDPDSNCLAKRYVSWCRLPTMLRGVAMFECENGRGTVHYTLVCDFRKDCQDGSDEAFCRHGQHCDGFTCFNGQCVDHNKRCDLVRNCVDGSDEVQCDYANIGRAKILLKYSLPAPAVINFHYGGQVTYTPVSSSKQCPETHFQCPGESSYCLPVFVRCNGVYDCPGWEDEAGCDSYTCPGYYRCRLSFVCVHADHLCDGLPHCPQHDDEWLCDSKDCPEGCECQGLASVCDRAFPASHFPDLRYLDADGSQMSPVDVSTNQNLVLLSLQFCNIHTLTDLSFPNLRSLYLGYNKLTSITMDRFQLLSNLRFLSLEGNPLASLEARRQSVIEIFHVSFTQIRVFDSKMWSGFHHLRVLNVSFSKIHTVSEGFRLLPNLVELDIKGNLVKEYPTNLFKLNDKLRKIHADNYKLCCKDLLPENFDENFCFAPEDEVSSCQDLLRSDVYRVLLWAMSVFSVVGNTGCVGARLLLSTTSKSGYAVFVSSLGLADLLMGVYLAMIGSADAKYRGNYILHEKGWAGGGVCQLAGFLTLLSCEVSAFMICLITLDRFLVLRFPFSTVRFQRMSACVVCVTMWLLGTVLAGLPFLPVTSHWEFYGQTGICIPLPITRQEFAGRSYAFGVMIVLNFVLFLLIAAGQASIYWSIRANAMSTDTTKKTQDLTIARRLITVAMSDFLCWFPIGLLGIMASMGLPVPGELNVAMAILVMPLNSVLNPFLYTFNLLAEKRRKQQEEQLTKLLEAQMTSENTGDA